MSTTAVSNSSTGGSTSTANSDSAYKLFDRVPHRPKWSSDHTLSIVVCRALYPVNEDMLRPILAPYGVQQLVVNPRVTKRNGSHYVKAIVELRSRDDAAEARVSLQGKCLFDGCCYLDVKFALPYELASMATSTGATSITASTACVIHDGVSHIEMPAGDSFLPPTNSVAVPSTTFSLVYPCTETVAASFAPYVLHQCCSELCGHHPCTEASEANKSEMGLSSMQAAAVSATTKVSMMPNDMSLQTAHDFAIFGTDQASVSACGATLDANDTSANKVFLDTEHMFPTTPMSSELSTFQPLEFYDCRRGAFVQWSPPLGMCVNLPMDLLEQDIQLQYIGRKQWLIEEISVEVSSIKEELEPINHLWTMMLNDLNEGFSLEHLWDPSGLILSSWYLQQLEAILSHKNSSSVDISEQESIAFANLQTALYSPWCMECVKSDIGKTQTCWLQLQPKPPWSHLTTVSFTSEFGSNVSAVSEPLLVIGITFKLNLNNIATWYIFCARAGSCSTLRNAKQLLSVDTSSRNLPNSTKLQNPSCWNGWSFILLLICWTPFLFIQWFGGLTGAVQGYTSSSTCTSLAFQECYASSSKSGQSILSKAVRSAGYLETRRSVLPPFSWDPGVRTLIKIDHGRCQQIQFEDGRNSKTTYQGIVQVHIARSYYLNYACYFDSLRADYYCDTFLDYFGCFLISSTSLKLPSTRATTVTMNGNYNGILAVLHGIGLGSSRILRKGGLLATSSIGLGYGLTPWALACLKTPKPATTYTRE
ncbi:uncharacterized protein LOC124708673 isoform X2 [Lolium rigidum]|uniref:uncharacterized protein LOC124708673 isoform X2 n=1 Tax=Lolium rigidum TaxID=89674 RepID=UPI001F5DBBB3|nr:uncharacterized protein LOC124708673 isoform X2 [Lolium rigidum]